MITDSPPVKMPPQTQKRWRKHASARQQGIEIQRLLAIDAITAPDGKTRAFIARSWCDVNEEVRKLVMRALPRPIDTTKMQRRGRRSAASPAPVEPSEPSAAS